MPSLELRPEEREKIVELLQHSDVSFVQQGLQLALHFMTDDEIVEIVYQGTKEGWKQDGINWVLLEQVPNADRWKNITSLDLSDNQLVSLPDSIGNLINLTELNLRGNMFLPEEENRIWNWLIRCKKIKKLDLSYNQLKSLPENIGNLTNLTRLDLSNNKLKILPDSFEHLTQLVELCLACNFLESLPESIGNLTKLTHLDLRFNQFPPEEMDRIWNQLMAINVEIQLKSHHHSHEQLIILQ